MLDWQLAAAARVVTSCFRHVTAGLYEQQVFLNTFLRYVFIFTPKIKDIEKIYICLVENCNEASSVQKSDFIGCEACLNLINQH